MLATDERFKNIYQDQPGLIIGRGDNENYQPNPLFETFKGIKIGCNTAYSITKLDYLIWMDPPFFVEHCHEIKQLDCLKFAVNPHTYPHHDIDIYELRVSGIEGCSESFNKGFYPCELSGYLALNISLIMGLNPIWVHGFTSDMKDQYGTIRSDKFNYLFEWAKKNNRKIYLTQEQSYLRKFFDYSPLPEIKNKKLKVKNDDLPILV